MKKAGHKTGIGLFRLAALMALCVALYSPCAMRAQAGGLDLAGKPVSFEGTLPCADCPGIDFLLDLKPDHTYLSRMIYQERSARVYEGGTWSLDDAGKVLTLTAKNRGTQKYAVRDDETLRQLDQNGNEIDSKLNFNLKRAAKFIPLGIDSSVAPKLENTEWKLVELNGATAQTGPKGAFLTLDSASHRVSGSGGCNRLVGSYQVMGDQLRFSPMAGTRMACAQGMEVEQAFLEAVGQVSRWKITGGKLQLLDSTGKVLARFAPNR